MWPSHQRKSVASISAEREVHMSNGLKRAEQYRDLAKRYIRLAAMSSSTENRNHYLRIAEHYSTLAEAEDLRTLGHVNGD